MENSKLPNNITETNNIFKDYPKSKELLTRFYPKLANISLDKYRYDPFFTTENMENIYTWYKKKNPNFEIMSEINPSPKMEEYNILIAGIIKDFYIYFKKNNLEMIRSNVVPTTFGEFVSEQVLLEPVNDYRNIFIKIEIMIKEEYPYNLIIDIIYDYLIFFQKKIKKSKDCDLLLKYYNSQYIIYPSFQQIDLYKVILNIKAPVLNFLMSNKNHKSHNSNVNICYELLHDIDFHYDNMMISFFRNLAKIVRSDNPLNSRRVIQISFDDTVKFIDDNKKIFEDYFIFMNKLVDKLKNDFIYKINRKIDNNFEKLKCHPDFEKYINCIILFYIFHENNFFDINNRIITKIKRLINKENIIKYFITQNYYLNCRNFLFSSNFDTIIKYIYNYNTDITKILSEEFKKLIKSTLFIDITSDNSIEIINLYKKSVNFIYTKINDSFAETN